MNQNLNAFINDIKPFVYLEDSISENEMEQWQTTLEVFTAVCAFMLFLHNSVATYDALNVFLEANPSLSENHFIINSKTALENQNTIEAQKLFDRAHFYNDNGRRDNCSITLLVENCKKLNFFFPQGDEPVIQKMEELQFRYEKVLPIDIRNKMMAHHDREQLFSGEERIILFKELFSLVIETIDCLEELGFILFNGIEIKLNNYTAYKEYILNDIKALCRITDGNSYYL